MDHLRLILRGHPKILERLTAISPDEVANTIITARSNYAAVGHGEKIEKTIVDDVVST